MKFHSDSEVKAFFKDRRPLLKRFTSLFIKDKDLIRKLPEGKLFFFRRDDVGRKIPVALYEKGTRIQLALSSSEV
jgi:hypothetical protein